MSSRRAIQLKIWKERRHNRRQARIDSLHPTILTDSSHPTILTDSSPNVRIYILCHNTSRFEDAKRVFASYYWAYPIMMKYQDVTFENAFWKQLLEIKSDWVQRDMVGVLSSHAHNKVSLEQIDTIIRSPSQWKQGYYHFIESSKLVGGSHTGTKGFCQILLSKLQLTSTTEAYCNYWMSRPSLMLAFISWFENVLKPTVLSLDGIMSNAHYKGYCKPVELLNLCGVPYYPFVPFVLERVLKCFFATYVFKYMLTPYSGDLQKTSYMNITHTPLNTAVDRQYCHIHISREYDYTFWQKYTPNVSKSFHIIITYDTDLPAYDPNFTYIYMPHQITPDAVRVHLYRILDINGLSHKAILMLDGRDEIHIETFCKSPERVELVKSLLSLDPSIQCIVPETIPGKPLSSYIVRGRIISHLCYSTLLQSPDTVCIEQIINSVINNNECDYIILPHGSAVTAYDIKLNAIYFPQYHDIPENNRFWGNGFTEWTLLQPHPESIGTSKGEVPIFKPHDDIGYYSLDDHRTLPQQIDIASSHGLNGFIIYHYWFSASQRVMYKPLERFLDSTITFPFCIAWANENWTKRWDGLNHEVLLTQTYTDNDQHIRYLLQFMKMPNYIKNSAGEHILYIYNMYSVPNYDTIIEDWKKAAEMDHIKLKIVGFNNSFKENDAVTGVQKYAFEPLYTSRSLSLHANGREVTYSMKDIMAKYYDNSYNASNHLGMTVGWNNIVRRKTSAYAWMSDCTIESMREFLLLLIAKLIWKNKNSTKYGPNKGDENFININAWNEWNEQAVLEPSSQYGYAILEMIRDVMKNV